MNVVLRGWDESDAEWYVAAIADPVIQRFTNEGAVTIEEMRAAIARLRGRDGVFAIADATSGAPVGNIGWVRDDGDRRRAEAYYWVDAPARGHGVAAAALDQLCEQARREGITSVRLEIDEDNEASRRTAERCGFAYARPGEPRDGRPTVVYERTSDEIG